MPDLCQDAGLTVRRCNPASKEVAGGPCRLLGELCSVAVDDVHGGRLAAEHLIGLGYPTIALVNGPSSIQQCADRRKRPARQNRFVRIDAHRPANHPVGNLGCAQG